jgi:hypothetical protein
MMYVLFIIHFVIYVPHLSNYNKARNLLQFHVLFSSSFASNCSAASTAQSSSHIDKNFSITNLKMIPYLHLDLICDPFPYCSAEI